MANKLGSENVFPIIRILEDATPPSTPPTGQVHFYVDEGTKTLHGLDDADVDTDYGATAVTDITDLPTAETDDTLRLAPDGAGGVEWAAGSGGGLPAAKAWLSGNDANEDIPASPNATYDDEFDDDTGMSGSGNGLAAKWNWRNQSTATATFGIEGWLTLSIPASSGANLRILEIAALADGTYDMKMSLEHGQGGDVGGGIVLVDNTNGDLYLWGFIWTAGAKNIYLQRWNNVTTWNSNIANMVYASTGIYLRVVKSGTNLTFWWSGDGIGWARLAATQSDAVGADRIGFGLYETSNAGDSKLHVDYFRKVA
jgi:hypothetical protein